MSRACSPARATHSRLSAETWALIVEEYQGEASAGEIAARWKVSPKAVYRRACLEGFNKAAVGDAKAQEDWAREDGARKPEASVEAGEGEASE